MVYQKGAVTLASGTKMHARGQSTILSRALVSHPRGGRQLVVTTSPHAPWVSERSPAADARWVESGGKIRIKHTCPWLSREGPAWRASAEKRTSGGPRALVFSSPERTGSRRQPDFGTTWGVLKFTNAQAAPRPTGAAPWGRGTGAGGHEAPQAMAPDSQR